MVKRTLLHALLAAMALLVVVLPARASAAIDIYTVTNWSPSHLVEGQEARLLVELNNRGNTPSTAAAPPLLKVQVSLPPNTTFEGIVPGSASSFSWNCAGLTTVNCTSSLSLPPYTGNVGDLFSLGKPASLMLDLKVGPGVTGTFPITMTVSGGGMPAPSVETRSVTLAETPLGFGIHDFVAGAFDEAGNDYVQAGGHPDEIKADFSLNVDKIGYGAGDAPVPSGGAVRDVVVDTPPGFVGDPTAVPRCTEAQLLDVDQPGFGTPACPVSSQVGYVLLRVPAIGNIVSPVYNMDPPSTHPAQFAFWTPVGPVRVRPSVRSDGDYGLTTTVSKITQADVLLRSKLVLWGNPADPVHDFQRCGNLNITTESCVGFGSSGGAQPKSIPHAAGVPEKAFLTLQTNCVEEPVTTFHLDSWDNPAPMDDLTDPRWQDTNITTPTATGCEEVPFGPSMTLRPTSQAADSPTGLDAHLRFPREKDTDPDAIVQSHLKDTTVTLPEGIRFNPTAADGLQACTMEQIGLTSAPGATPITFDNREPACPDAAKIGSGEVVTPLLRNPLHGEVFLASQNLNPFNSTYAVYLVVREPSILVKLAGRVDVDRVTGQITNTFANSPQLPFTDLNLSFYGGSRASLATPVTCGTFTSQTTLSPWSAADPGNPTPSEQVQSPDSFEISSGPNGSACAPTKAARPFALGLSAGAQNPLAGAASPFSLRITRPDGAQEISTLDISPPPGFAAYLKGIPYCSEAQIAAAARITGKAEQASPSCPAASQVGTTSVGAGPGPNPLYTPGKLYFAGPYKGAPLSVVAITPAVAGPFDLGNVVVRSALVVNPSTARITAKTDPIPQILEGVPLGIRDLRISLDRPNWALNPTNCNPMSVDIAAAGASGARTTASERFQLGGCAALPFKPKFHFRLFGGTKRGKYPRFQATMTARPGEANIGRAAVTLPHSAFLEQNHIKTSCTRVQFAADACPAGSIYGKAEATTPLLDAPLAGPVYLRASSNPLPDLVATLKGPDRQPIEIELAGRIDSKNAGIRNTFDVVPDAPVTEFTLSMQGGKKGLLVNSRNLCKAPARADVKMIGQNGKRSNSKPLVANSCKKARKGKKSKSKSAGKR
ncbi:MAG TPA: hypothetical protein VEW07_09150 [Solirubrobacterales bacterium]|nr:hypothetical protein [Solirubrobacterales bacterium]